MFEHNLNGKRKMGRKYLIFARKALGLKQSDVANMIGCSQELISKAERGFPVRVETAKQISTVLGLDWTQFYADELTSKPQQPHNIQK